MQTVSDGVHALIGYIVDELNQDPRRSFVDLIHADVRQ
jgi:hypothetical protein